MKNTRISVVKDNDISNGAGVGVSLFFTGCRHHCPGCFNGQTWNPTDGMSMQMVMDTILPKLDKQVKKHLSFLGGDPLFDERNKNDMLTIAKKAKEKYGTVTWMWTGEFYEDVPQEVADTIDFIVDGKFVLDLKTNCLFRGSSNQRIFLHGKDITKEVDNRTFDFTPYI